MQIDTNAGETAATATGSQSASVALNTFWGRFFCALSLFAALLAATTPTPLYPIYIEEWNLPEVAGPTIFSIYAVGTLFSLLLAGWLSRRISDSRTLLIPALLLAVLGAILFAIADQVWLLFVGRLLSGLSTGLISSTASSALLNLDRKDKHRRAALVSSVAFTAGAAAGPCVSSLALAIGLAPLVTPYLFIAAISIISLLGLMVSPWPKDERGQISAHQSGTAGQPARVKQSPQMLLAFIAVTVAWMLGAVLMASSVSIATQLFHLNIYALAGLLPAIFQLCAGIGQILGGRYRPLLSIMVGALFLAVLQIIVIVGALNGVPAVFVLAMPLCGLFYGATFVGSAGLVNEVAVPGTHATQIVKFFVVGYIAMSVPTFAFGKLIDGVGLTDAFVIYSLVHAALALATALLAAKWWRQQEI